MVGPTNESQFTPRANPPSLKKSTSGSQSSKDQKSILGFFQKKSAESPKLASPAQLKANGTRLPLNGSRKTTWPKGSVRGSSQSLTPAPSSDALEEPEVEGNIQHKPAAGDALTGLLSPITPAVSTVAGVLEDDVPSSFGSPSRKASALAAPSIRKLTSRNLGEEGGELCRV